MKRNKRLKLAEYGLITSLLATSIATLAASEVTDRIEKTIDFNTNGKIQLSNINGDVSIKACDCEQVSIIAEIMASSQEERDRIDVNIKESANQITIKTKYKKNQEHHGKNRHSKVTYQLSVPNHVKLDDIELVNGNLTVKGVTGEFNSEMVNGNLSSDSLTASANIKMVNGDADIRFKNLHHVKNIDIDSVNGNIQLHIPADSNASIDASTVSGSLSNEFNIQVNKHKFVGSDMRGKIGSGGVDIELENVNGKISVNSL
ncbi:DUF4097 family beta strand repeat-containing protein [Aliikangiella sp. IMCC44359]|uniref:DUF4097 family beta strand repeat-containing protein n=1 Tax=Aliikangiella sp. IMCC44359 TaxID=3459125 RepID=UPI00403AF5BB